MLHVLTFGKTTIRQLKVRKEGSCKYSPYSDAFKKARISTLKKIGVCVCCN